jgi:hypothetical protein
MRASPKADDVRTGRVGLAALATIGAALLAAAALATYEASLARAHAVRNAVPETASSALQYLPGSSQIGTLREPLMEARRAALRDGFDRDDAPIDAFDRLRSVPGHDDEARSLLAQFWGRKALLADNPLHRVLYALQARVLNDDESTRRTAASAMAALGPLREARHVAEGTIVSADARTLVMRGSGWLHVSNLETGTSFDLSDSDAGSALVDGRRMVTWGDDTARIWDLDSASAAPTSPAASFKLLAGETPLAFVGTCAVTSDGRVWREGAATGMVTVAHGRWRSGSINPDCDRVVLQGDRIAAYRRRGDTWISEPSRAPGKAPGVRGGPFGKAGEVQVEACAARAPRCVVRDSTGVRSIWDFGSSPPRRLYEGVQCEARRFSPDGTRLMCSPSQDGITLYSEDEEGGWARADVLLPALTGSFLQDDGTICGSMPWKDATATDRSDVLFFAPRECPGPPAVERTWGTIHMLPTGNGAVFTFPPTEQGASGYTEFLGFDSRGESLAAASNAWFGQRTDERLLEHDATNSAEEKGYELAGAPFDPALALGLPLADAAPPEHVSSVQIDKAFFVESPEPTVVLEIGYVRGGQSAPVAALRAVARWDVRGKHFCGAALPGAITSVAPTGDALAIDGRLYGIGACTAAGGFEPTDVTGLVAVAPGAARWIAREGDSLQLQAPQREPIAVPSAGMRGDKDGDTQVAFNPNGDRFFVRTATSLCDWVMRGDGTLDLDGCRWSTAGWASAAAWAAADKGGETVVVFDRTAEGAALRQLFGGREGGVPGESGGALACSAIPKAVDPPLAVLRQWEERLGHRFKDQAIQLQDAREMASPEIVPMDAPTR